MHFGIIVKYRKWIIASTVSITVLLLLAWFCFFFHPRTMVHGVYIEEVNVSGKTREQAAQLVSDAIRKKNTLNQLVLAYGSQSWNKSYSDLGMGYFIKKAVYSAYSIGHSGFLLQRVVNTIECSIHKRSVGLTKTYDKAALKTLLLSIKKQVDQPKRDAAVLYENGKISITKEVEGKLLDVDKNMKLIDNRIEEGKLETFELSVDPVPAEVRYEAIKQISQPISAFYTSYNPAEVNRTRNIELACQRINGLILFPGVEFSMDRALGPRTEENGYKDAKIIFNSEYIDGIGGGICQLATTLYNAVLKSKLTVTARSHHSIPSLYVGLGQDATIAEGLIDFRFVNNRDYPVCICAEMVKNRIVITLLGKMENEVSTVKLVPQIIEVIPAQGEDIVIDNTLPDSARVVASEAKNGYRVILYRETNNAKGEMIEREKISEDVYKPIKAKIKMNETTLRFYKENNGKGV